MSDFNAILWESKARAGYADGYRNGVADRDALGYPLQVALHSSRPGYATGYGDGYYGRPNKQEVQRP